jgi:hypothetical protein
MFKTLSFLMFAILLSACAENSSSLTILQNQAPDDGCSASNSLSDQFVSHGVLDLGAAELGITPQYYAWLVVKNNLRSTMDSHGIELNSVEMKEARIDLNLGSAGSGLGAYTSFADYTFVMISPGETRSMQISVIPPNLGGRLSLPKGQFVDAVAKIRLVGERGGSEIETHSIHFPITLCNGCLIENIGSCATATFPETVYLGHSCNKSQDKPLHCCRDTSVTGDAQAYRCPAVKAVPDGDGNNYL